MYAVPAFGFSDKTSIDRYSGTVIRKTIYGSRFPIHVATRVTIMTCLIFLTDLITFSRWSAPDTEIVK